MSRVGLQVIPKRNCAFDVFFLLTADRVTQLRDVEWTLAGQLGGLECGLGALRLWLHLWSGHTEDATVALSLSLSQIIKERERERERERESEREHVLGIDGIKHDISAQLKK